MIQISIGFAGITLTVLASIPLWGLAIIFLLVHWTLKLMHVNNNLLETVEELESFVDKIGEAILHKHYDESVFEWKEAK